MDLCMKNTTQKRSTMPGITRRQNKSEMDTQPNLIDDIIKKIKTIKYGRQGVWLGANMCRWLQRLLDWRPRNNRGHEKRPI